MGRILPMVMVTVAVVSAGCATDDLGNPSAKKTTPPPDQGAEKQAAQAFLKAQLNDRIVEFDVASPMDNYVFGDSLRLRAETADRERIELIGTGLLPPDASFPLVVHGTKDKPLVLHYTTGGSREWTDEAVTLRIESFQEGRMVGSLSSEQLRPNKPAVPIRISGAVFELNVATRY